MSSKKFCFVLIGILAFGILLSACQPTPVPTTVPALVTEAVVETTEAVVETTEAVVETTEAVVETTEAVVPAMPSVVVPTEADGKFIRWSLGETDIPTVDPALSTDTSSNQINQLIFAGIMNQDEVTAEFKLGVATDVVKGEIAEDGSVTYTYKLRTDIPWVKYNAENGAVEQVADCDGNPRFVTAGDYEYAIKRTANPETASDYAFMVTGYIVGAEAFFTGSGTADDVKVKAVDAETIEITYIKDIAPNSMIAGIWVTYAVPQWVIEGDTCTEASEDRWIDPANIQTYGPFAVKEWVHDDLYTVVTNPFWPKDIENIAYPKIDGVIFRILSESAGLAEYEAGNLDGMNTVPVAEMDRIKADEAMGAEFSAGPNFCTYFYGFNTTKPFVDDARVRRALSLSIDRKSLVENVTKGGQIPAQWFSRPGLVASPDLAEYPDLGVKYDPEKAQAELQSYMDEKEITDAKDIVVELMFNTSESHAKIAQAVQQMWADTLGITADIKNQEWAVYLKTIREKDTPQIWRLGWCQDYPDAANFPDDQASSGGSANPTVDGLAGSEPAGGFMWYNQEFEDLVNAALVESDIVKRTELYAKAEQILVFDDAAMAPLYWYTSPQLAKSYLVRTYSVSGGKEAFQNWDIVK